MLAAFAFYSNSDYCMTENSRVAYLDTGKGIAMFLIVLLHLVPGLYSVLSYLSLYNVCYFFMVSGMLYKEYGSPRAFVLRKVNTLAVPFVGWYCIGYLVHLVGSIVAGMELEPDFGIFKIFHTNEIFNLPAWFILSLFWCQLLFYAVRRILRNAFAVALGVLVLASAGIAMSRYGVNNFLYIGSSLSCLPFFFLGRLLASYGFSPGVSPSRRVVLAGLAVAVGAFVLMACLFDAAPDFSCYRNELSAGAMWQYYLCAIAFIVALLSFCCLVGRLPLFTWLGRNSLVALVAHLQPSVVVSLLLASVFVGADEVFVIPFLTFAVVMALMPLIVALSKRFLPRISGYRDLISPEKNRIFHKIFAS